MSWSYSQQHLAVFGSQRPDCSDSLYHNRTSTVFYPAGPALGRFAQHHMCHWIPWFYLKWRSSGRNWDIGAMACSLMWQTAAAWNWMDHRNSL